MKKLEIIYKVHVVLLEKCESKSNAKSYSRVRYIIGKKIVAIFYTTITDNNEKLTEKQNNEDKIDEQESQNDTFYNKDEELMIQRAALEVSRSAKIAQNGCIEELENNNYDDSDEENNDEIFQNEISNQIIVEEIQYITSNTN
ncbi:hypothetical protein RhiirA4_453028 [Rhizophagus irregularis]|uniref:Uncharacterized protein n=1 Tax=Rhizophagus irregularis TaxID=588596 RepID=A0A2I1FZK2_9GLOM|nr:hypothetical protein RhiirA4_453028 [Rhizophagus irregularis]